MSYTLKIEVDGFDLAVLIQEMMLRAGFTGDEDQRFALVTIVGELADELPMGRDDSRTLKLDWDIATIQAVLAVLHRSMERNVGRDDHRALSVMRLARGIENYMALANEARRVGGAG